MACPECLGRAWLLGRLAGAIQRAVADAAGARARDLLALDDAALTAAMLGRAGANLARQTARRGRELAAALRSEPPGGTWALCRHAAGYPSGLRDLGDSAPYALFVRGDRHRLDALAANPAVAIVGARRATPYGREVAAELGRQLAAADLSVVSGLAYGVDSAAHRGALAGEGLTVAVLGSGADVPSPAGERQLYGRVAAAGLVVSEMPPGSPPFPWCFPARNRIIAALVRLAVVVEARQRSGSLITAGMAADLGRDVGAVPGPVTSSLSAGTNKLLAEGAAVIRDARDALDVVLGPGSAASPAERPPLLEPPLAAALDAVEAGARTADEVAAAAGLDGAGATVALAGLELRGLVRADFSGRYARTAR